MQRFSVHFLTHKVSFLLNTFTSSTTTPRLQNPFLQSSRKHTVCTVLLTTDEVTVPTRSVPTQGVSLPGQDTLCGDVSAKRVSESRLLRDRVRPNLTPELLELLPRQKTQVPSEHVVFRDTGSSVPNEGVTLHSGDPL